MLLCTQNAMLLLFFYLDGKSYTDHTCIMGNPYYSDEVGAMCYNPGKRSW